MVGSSLDHPSNDQHVTPRGVDFLLRPYVEPRQAVRDASTDVVVLGSSVRDRSYWLQEVAKAGKHALCAPPLSSSYRRLHRLTRLYAEAGLRLACLSDAGASALSKWLAARQYDERTGTILYLRLHVSIPRSKLEEDAEGILLRHGVPYLALLGRFGSVDAVLGRARSLVANRPTEDVAVGFLRFSTGIEATVEFNGLGSTECATADFYGRLGHTSFAQKPADRPCSLLERIADFTSRIDDDRQASSDVDAIYRGHQLAAWMLKSARFDRELSKREVQLD
jgi:predicted dehydrogenase